MTEQRHGDPLDREDIPADSGLSEEYRKAAWHPSALAAQKRKPEGERPAKAKRPR